MSDSSDLGFSYRLAKSGDMEIARNGRVVTRLRGKQAAQAANRLDGADFAGQQQLMARLTGHYRQGNERQGKNRRKR